MISRICPCYSLGNSARRFCRTAFDDFSEEFTKLLNDRTISELDGINLGENCGEIIENVYENPENPAAPLLKYLVTLTRCSMEDVEELIKMATDKYTDEFEIHMSDVEEEMLEDKEE